MKYSRIMFAGPSGIGKTTMAKFVSNLVEGQEFISGSMSNLMDNTKNIYEIITSQSIYYKSPLFSSLSILLIFFC